MQRPYEGGLAAFFRDMEDDAVFQKEAGVAPNISQEMRDRVSRIKMSFVLPKPPEPFPLREEEDIVVAVEPERKQVSNTTRIQECKKCRRVFALKKTLDMHMRVCSGPV
jgi:hypothetical protein